MKCKHSKCFSLTGGLRVINDPDRQCFSLTGGLRVINNPDRKYLKTSSEKVEFSYDL